MDLSTTSEQNFKKDDVLTSVNSTKRTLSTWQQQKILFLRALICIKRDSVSKNLRANTIAYIKLKLL